MSSDFKIGEPMEMPKVKKLSKYTELINLTKGMEDGLAVPLEFENDYEAIKFVASTINTFRNNGVRVQRRQNRVFLSRRES